MTAPRGPFDFTTVVESVRPCCGGGDVEMEPVLALALSLYRDPDLIGVFFTYYYPSQKGILKKKA